MNKCKKLEKKMKVGDLVMHVETECLGILIEDDRIDQDGLYLCWYGYWDELLWVDDEDVTVINESR